MTEDNNAPRDLGGLGGAGNSRTLYTDTHCNTDGYTGSFKPIRVAEREQRPVTGAAVTTLLAVAVFSAAWMASYLAGCMA